MTADTQRERVTGKAPPLNRLHVWWARRPLTPSRAAIVASLAPADMDPELFVRQLGIERVQALVNGEPWTLTGDLLERVIQAHGSGAGGVDAEPVEALAVDARVLKRLGEEDERRAENRQLIERLKAADPQVASDPVLQRREAESQPVPRPWPEEGTFLPVRRVMGVPAWFKGLMALAQTAGVRVPNLYGYERAFANPVECKATGVTVLDPTAGGGSIPFEALRLGHNVIANELNPVATTILYATLDHPARFVSELATDIERWGNQLLQSLDSELSPVLPRTGPVTADEAELLRPRLSKCPELVPQFSTEDVTTYLFVRQVTCPHCGGEAPLLNTFWLSKEAGDPWGVKVIVHGHDARGRHGKVRFETYRLDKGRGPGGEDPESVVVSDGHRVTHQKKGGTVDRGTGWCVHCRQAIDAAEVKRQARGESPHGRWVDRLYAVVAVRHEPKVDRDGNPEHYASGARKGELKTRKVRFFRPPNARDLAALAEPERRLAEKWPAWEAAGLIPTEEIPYGHRRDQRDGIVRYGIERWTDMFTPRPQGSPHIELIEA